MRGARDLPPVAHRADRGMTLAEIMAALIIGAMVLSAVLGIYGHLTGTARRVLERLDEFQQPAEVLQLIAEDLDRLVNTGPDTRVILLPPKFDSGFQLQRLEIHRTYLDAKEKEQLLESIIWQTAVDYVNQRMILYRAHQGEVFEDRLLDQARAENTSLYPFVPVCSGLSYFQIQVPQGENPLDTWQNVAFPHGLRVTLSFAEPTVPPRGEISVPEESLISRTIAVDRSRTIRFEMPKSQDPNNANSGTGSGRSPRPADQGGPRR